MGEPLAGRWYWDFPDAGGAVAIQVALEAIQLQVIGAEPFKLGPADMVAFSFVVTFGVAGIELCTHQCRMFCTGFEAAMVLLRQFQ